MLDRLMREEHKSESNRTGGFQLHCDFITITVMSSQLLYDTTEIR